MTLDKVRLRQLQRQQLDVLQGALKEEDRCPFSELTELELATLATFAGVLAVRAAAAGDDQRHFSIVLCILLQQLLPKAEPPKNDHAIRFAQQLVSLFVPEAEALEVWAEISGIRIRDLHTCKVCGCTDDDACFNLEGQTCTWVAPNLCSACFDKPLIVAR